MRKSLAKIFFKTENKPKLQSPWCTATQGCEPNDWSIRINFIEELQEDNSAMAEIDFLMPYADYLLVPGTKFKIFYSKCEVFVEVIKEI